MPVACVSFPMDTAWSPLAMASFPMATEFAFFAFAPLPMATELLSSAEVPAEAPLPKANECSPLAAELSPMAIDLFAAAFAPSPKTREVGLLPLFPFPLLIFGMNSAQLIAPPSKKACSLNSVGTSPAVASEINRPVKKYLLPSPISSKTPTLLLAKLSRTDVVLLLSVPSSSVSSIVLLRMHRYLLDKAISFTFEISK